MAMPSYYHTAILDKAKVSPEFNNSLSVELCPGARKAKLVDIAVLATIDRLLVALPMDNRRYWGLGFVTSQGGDIWGIHTGCSIDHLYLLELLPQPTLLYLLSSSSLFTGQGPFASPITEFACVPLSYLTLFDHCWGYQPTMEFTICFSRARCSQRALRVVELPSIPVHDSMPCSCHTEKG